MKGLPLMTQNASGSEWEAGGKGRQSVGSE